jgi:hypothetical protein
MHTEEPIVASFRWTADEAIAAQSSVFRQVLRLMTKTQKQILLAILILGIVSALIGSLTQENPLPVFVIFLAFILSPFLIAYLLFRFVIPMILKANIQRQFEDNPALEKRIVATIDAQSITWKPEGSNGSTRTWKDVAKVIQTPGGFGFYFETPEKTNIWIPRHAFESETDIRGLSELCRGKAQEFEQAG